MAAKATMNEDKLRSNFIQAVGFSTVWIAASTLLDWGIAAQVAGPLAAMARYWQVFSGSDHAEYLAPMFADSLYYMGFILTVASLVASLLPYMVTDADPTPELLLGRFGVALTTTLAGILGRTYHSAFRPDTDQLEQKAIVGVRERSAQLQMELEKAGDEFAAFNARMAENYERLGQTLEEDVATFYEKSLERIEALVGETNARLEQSLKDSSKVMEASMREASRMLEESMQASSDELEHSLKRTVASVDGAVQGVSERLGELELDPSALKDAVVQSFSGITDELASISGTVSEAERVIGEGLGRMRAVVEDAASMEDDVLALRRAGEGLREVGEGLGVLSGSVDALGGSLSRAAEGGESLGEAMGEQIRGVERFRDLAADLGDSMQGYVAGVRSVVEGMEEQGEGFHAVRTRLEGEVAGLEERTRHFYSGLSKAVDGYSSALEEMSNLIAKTMEAARKGPSPH